MDTGADSSVQRSARWRWLPSDIALVHGSAAVIVLVSAVCGRLPFLWVADTLLHRPSWVGLSLAWLALTAIYMFAWQQVGRGNRAIEVLVTIALVLNGIWACFILLVSVLQTVGLGVNGLLVHTLPWWLRVVAALAVLVGAVGYVRLGQATAGAGGAAEESLGRITPPPAALVVSAVGFLLCAWSLALLAPPQATPAGAASAVLAATRNSLDTQDVVRFQNSVDEVIQKNTYVHPRDRWSMMRGFFSNGQKVTYDNTIQWGEMVLYRDQITCVASDVKTHRVVVRAGFCPG